PSLMKLHKGLLPPLLHDEDGITDLMVKFDRTSVQELLEVGDEVEIVITGELTDGTSFEGTDTIRVIDKSND
ncbi:unnamed protein product, partial [marine sediment metagenome]